MGTDNRPETQFSQQIRTSQFVNGIAMGMQESHHRNIKTAALLLSEALTQV